MFTNLSLGSRIAIFITITLLATATCVVAGVIIYRFVINPSPPAIIPTQEVQDPSLDLGSTIGAPGIPDLVATDDSGSSNSDNITNVAAPQFTGICRNDDKINLISSLDGALGHGEIVCTSSNFTISLDNALSEGVHLIGAIATDPEGNTSGSSSALNLTIDTTPPVAPSVPDLSDASDTGSSQSDNVTNDITPQFTGTCTPGDTIKISSSIDGDQFPDAICPGGSYDITLTSNLSEVTHAISATASDLAGNSSSSQPLNVTIETLAPNAPGAPDLTDGSDTGISNIDNVTQDNTPRFTGICNSGDTITLHSSLNGDLLPEVVCANGLYDVTLVNALSDGSHSITARARDNVGNTTNSQDLYIVIDTSPPGSPSVPDLAAGSDSGRSQIDNITKFTSPQFVGTCAEGDRISLTSSSGGVLSPAFVFCSGGSYDITVNNILSEVDHSIYAQATDTAGNSSGASGGISVTVDTVAPAAPGIPDLSASSDTGSSDTDNVTSDTTPQFAGTCSSNDEINLQSDVHGGLTPSDAICSGNAYDITLTSPLSETTHAIRAVAIDVAGNISPASAGLSVTIGSTTPSAPGTPDLADSSDTGSSNSDNITKTTSPQFTGTCSGSDKINLSSSVDGALNPSDTVCSGGSYSITLTSTLTETSHNITATATNADGTSPASAALGVTIDTTAPAAPGTPDLSAGSDTGSSNTDNVTSDTTPQFTGSCENGMTVTLTSAQSGALSPTGACSSGAYDITLSSISQDSHDITATQADTAGNTSPSSSILEVKVVIPTLAVSVSGNTGSDAVTSTGGTPSEGAINCPTTRCDTDFLLDDSVTLNVTVDGASSFTGWSGDCSSFGANLSGVLTMNDNKNCTATFAALTFPEMDVEGNATSIADGDTSPDAADHTNFGDVTVGSNLDRTFTIQNEGANTLSLTDFPTAVTLSGSGDFSIQSQPSSGTIASGGADLTFVVRCTPSSVATVTTTVSIANNDSNENPYDFSLSCNGVAAPAPEIDVEGNATSISDGDASPDAGDHTNFGTVAVGSSLDRTFTIQNEGSDTLNLTDFPTAVTLSGSGDFSVQTQPSAGSIASGGADLTFVVRCTPSAAATVTTTVSIANNDADENPYDFALSCTGANLPEIDVQRPAATSISDGGTVDLGTHDAGSASLLFVLDNSAGTAQLSVSGVTADNLNNVSNFALNSTTPIDIPAGDTGTFEISFDIDSEAAFSLDIDIANDDSDENPYDIQIIGTGAAAPEMDVEGNDEIIYSGDASPDTDDHTDFGDVDTTGATVTRTFVIKNTGTNDLTFSDSPIVTIAGTHAADFTLTADAATPVTGGDQTSFTITFDPSDSGVREATISIANNDGDENPYTFSIQGTGTGAAPEMDVLGNSISIPSGDTSQDTNDQTDFGDVDVASGSQTYTFTIQNSGSVDLNLSGSPIVTIGGTHSADFTLDSDATTPVTSGGGTTTFQITFDPSDAGLREATISIANDDSDENPYTFSIQGTGTTP